MVPGLDRLDALAHPLHHARALMAQHQGAVSLVPTVAEVDIGVADTRGDEAHEDFVVPRAFHLEGFDP